MRIGIGSWIPSLQKGTSPLLEREKGGGRGIRGGALSCKGYKGVRGLRGVTKRQRKESAKGK